MKNYDKYIPWFVGLYILAIALTVVYFFGLFTTFDKQTRGIIEGSEVRSVYILNDKKEVKITDQETIDRFLNLFKDVKLMEVSSSQVHFRNSDYWVTVYVNNYKKFSFNVYDDQFLSIFDPEKRKDRLKYYRIRSEVDLGVLKDIFNSSPPI